MQRARETCELAGLGYGALVEPDLLEWNYGDYEGLTPEQIHEIAPSWLIFRDGCPGGETVEEVTARVDRVLARARAVDGNVALFAHGHILRVLAARWLGLPASAGKHFLLNTGTLSVLAYYRDIPAVNVWNSPFFDNTVGEDNTKGERPTHRPVITQRLPDRRCYGGTQPTDRVVPEPETPPKENRTNSGKLISKGMT
jgi:probable phosphoglycerate mutase